MLTRFSDTSIQLDSLIAEVSLDLPKDVGVVERRLPLGHQSLASSSKTKNTFPSLESFDSGLTLFGKIFDLKQDSIFEQLSVRLLRNRSTLVLTPLCLSNGLGYKFQAIRLNFPAIIHNRCVSVSEFVEGQQLVIVVDVLLTNNVLVTLAMRPQFFVDQEFDVTTSFFYHWCGYSRPYSFDVRPPLFSYAVNSSNIIFALKDGGILRLDRPDPLSKDQLVQPFSDASYLASFKSRWFRKSLISLPENVDPSHIAIENVSTSSQLSVLTCDDFMITLSVDKILRMWSLYSNSVLFERNLSEDIPQDLAELTLSVSPCDLLTLTHLSNGNYTVAVHLPLGDSGIVKVYNVSVSRDYITSKIQDAQFQPLFETVLEGPNKTATDTWLFHSSQIVKTSLDGSKLRMFIAWVFNNSRLLQAFDINTNDGSVIAYRVVNNDENTHDPLEAVRVFKTEAELNAFFVRKLFSEFGENVLKAIVPIFEKRHNLDIVDDGKAVPATFTDATLAVTITKLIKKSVSANKLLLQNLESQWRKFYSACSELSKSTQQIVTFNMKTGGKFGLFMKSQDYSVVKSAMCFEIMENSESVVLRDLPFGVTSQAVEQMVKLLHDFVQTFSSESLKLIQLNLMRDYFDDHSSQSWEDRMNSIFESDMADYVTSDIGNALLSRLADVDNATEVIDYITRAPHVHLSGFKPIKNSPMGEYGVSALTASIKTQIKLQNDIVFKLLLVVLSVDVNDTMVKIYSRLLSVFVRGHLALFTLRIGFKDDGELESDTVVKNSQLLFTSIIKRLNDDGVLITSSKMNKLTECFVDFMIYQDEFVYAAVAWLLSTKQPGIAHDEIMHYLPKDSPLSDLLKGLIHMELGDGTSSFDVLSKSSMSIANYKTTILETRTLEPLQVLTRYALLGVGSETVYFMNLADLFDTQGLTEVALKLSLASITCQHTEDELIKYGHDQQWQFFKLSLKTNEFQMAYHAILNINRKYRPECVKMFVLKLFEQDQAKLLTSFANADDLDLVHQIVYELGESAPVLESLRYYKVCYAWRMNYGDYRGACESLYRFISRIQDRKSSTARLNKSSIVLAELYLIILNLLSTLNDNDDKWILCRALKPDEPNKLKTLADLKTEYSLVVSHMKNVIPL